MEKLVRGRRILRSTAYGREEPLMPGDDVVVVSRAIRRTILF